MKGFFIGAFLRINQLYTEPPPSKKVGWKNRAEGSLLKNHKTSFELPCS